MPLNQIEIRSQEINEILGKTPNRIIRWGVSVIFLVVFTLLIGSWFFRYPDTIQSDIEITTYTTPVKVTSNISGKLDTILIRDNEYVTEGMVLAVLQSSANYHDINFLISKLPSFRLKDSYALDKNVNFINNQIALGDLQTPYSNFVSTYSEYRNFKQLKFHANKIESLKKLKEDQQLLYDRTLQQQLTLEEELELCKKKYTKYEFMYKNQINSDSVFEQVKSKYLQKKSAFEKSKTDLASIQINITQLENTMLDLHMEERQTEDHLLLKLELNYNIIMSSISSWENNYLLKSPSEGVCVFTSYLNKNQSVSTGEPLMTIVPTINQQNVMGKVLLPVQGSGKVKKGQIVNIKLHNYPHMEYGMVTGIIGKISPVPNGSQYYAEVVFPEGLKTNFGKVLEFSHYLQGTAEIITNDLRLLHRILQPLRSIWKDKIEQKNFK